MSLVIYVDGEAKRPWEKFQKVVDDFGNIWKAKMGEMVAHHWALEHSEYRILDPSEMTPWHINFQNILEKKCGYKLEQLRKTPEGFRKADALNKELGVVVEVQYSNIEEKVLYDRTKFWVDLGFTVVWIFNDKKHANFEGKYKNQQRWSRQPVWWRTFQEFRSNVEIIIQSPKLERIIIEDAEGDEDIVEQKTFYQIEEASYRPRFKKAKFLCKTSPLTKRELIRQLKGESFYDLYMQKVRALKK